MADTKIVGGGGRECRDEEEGHRGPRGHRGHRGHDGPTGPRGPDGFQVPTPPFEVETTIIYASMDGSDEDGDGKTPATAFRTLQHAARFVPNVIGSGKNFIIDISGVGGVVFDELLPPDYVLPVWKAPIDVGFESDDPFFKITGQAVAIRAIPQLVSTLTPAEATINLSDVATLGANPIISGATNTLPITITAVGHGLANGQGLSIVGVTGDVAANGAWFISGVTGNTFDLVGSDGTLSGVYAGGGTILNAVPDPLTKLITLTLNAARPAWGTSNPGVVGSGLKGKFAVGPTTVVRTHPIVGENTPMTILLTTPALSVGGLPAFPIRLMEPSAHLHAVNSFSTFSTIVALNNDSIAFNGIKITADTANGLVGLLVGGMGQVCVQLCELESPIIESVNDYQAKILTNWFYGAPSFQSGSFETNSGLFDNTGGASGPFFVFGPPMTQPSFTASVFDNADPISYGVFFPFHGVKPASTAQFGVTSCLIRGSTGPGIAWHGGNGFVQDCDIYGCAGSAIEVTLGQGVLQVLNCGSSGGGNPLNAPNGVPALAAIFVNDGAYVKVDGATVAGGIGLTPLQGGLPTQDMQVGPNAGFRTWSDFDTGLPSGRPVRNELDYVSFTSGVGGTFSDATPAPTYVDGTGSRLYE